MLLCLRVLYHINRDGTSVLINTMQLHVFAKHGLILMQICRFGVINTFILGPI